MKAFATPITARVPCQYYQSLNFFFAKTDIQSNILVNKIIEDA